MSNEYISLDSHTCKSVLGEEAVRRVKRIITRINVKSYIICLNSTSSGIEQSSSSELSRSQSSTLIGVKASQTSSQSTCSSLMASACSKKPDLITSCYYFGDDLNTVSQSTCSSPTATALDKLKRQQQAKSSSAVRESKSYVLEYVIEPTTPFRRLTILEAKKRGLLNVEKGLYTNPVNNTVITIEEAIELGLIGTRPAGRRLVLDTSETSAAWTPKTKRNHESTTLTIESVLDPKTNLYHTVSDAVKMGLIDQASLSYSNTLTGAKLSLNDAFVSGFVKGQIFQNQNRTAEATKILNEIILGNRKVNKQNGEKESSPTKSDCVFSQTSDGKSVLQESEEKSVQIKSIFNPLTQTFVSLEQAIAEKLFDKSTGIYTDPSTGRKMSLNELALNGYLKTSSHIGPEKSVLVIDIKKEDPDCVKTYRVNTETKTTIEDVLYELKELEQLTQMELENGSKPTGEIELRAKKTGGYSGLKPQIIERRIPSFYGSDQRLVGSETLIIDDVRQSAMIEINGEMHILKNECHIDDSAEQLNRVDLTTPSKEKKFNNRTVIVVEDQLINGKAKPSETLKIDVRSKKAASFAHLNNSTATTIDKNDYSSNEFLTRSERAQFERVNVKKTSEYQVISHLFVFSSLLHNISSI